MVFELPRKGVPDQLKSTAYFSKLRGRNIKYEIEDNFLHFGFRHLQK